MWRRSWIGKLRAFYEKLQAESRLIIKRPINARFVYGELASLMLIETIDISRRPALQPMSDRD